MKFYTRPKDNYECRFNACTIEEWIEELTGFEYLEDVNICEHCPFMEAINKLGEYEDERR